MINCPALWRSGDGRESGPGPEGNASGCRGFRNKGPVRARYLHIIIWNGYKIAGKAPSPLGIPQRRMPGRSGRGERAREQSCGGEAGVLYFVFLRNPVACSPFFRRSVLRSARRLCPASVWDTGPGGARRCLRSANRRGGHYFIA